ncbi:MAG: hypothetical protein K6G16_09110 [Lachnospiraceae bacterium]|nr:hypothetical protein [Lachnospiraceae bacterium]
MEAIVIGIIVALIVAFIAVRMMIAQMRPVAEKHEASHYTKDEDVHITVRDDVYLRTDVSRRKIERKQGN